MSGLKTSLNLLMKFFSYKTHILRTRNKKLKFKKKVITLFVDFFLFAAFSQIIYELICLFLDKERFYPWSVKLFSFFLYYSLIELRFNKTLGMVLLKVELNNPNQHKMNLNFIIYTLTSILDRTILLPIHMLIAIMNYENVFLCERLSGIKWKQN